MAARPTLFSIPPGAPFLATLADALIAGDLVGDVGWGRDPLAVADLTIYLPTRRAARALASVLAERADGPTALPRITPLGDADDAELRLIGWESDADALAAADDAPAAAPAERLVVLADLVMRWRDQLARAVTPLGPGDHRLVAATAGEAFALAGDLARVLDTLTIEGVDAAALAAQIPGEQDLYWSAAREFLGIATQVWPAWLATQGLADPVMRRDAALRRRARQIAAGAAAGPILAAGSTGTNPATAELLAAVARHPRGAVVLPGLDLIAADAAFTAVLDPDDPQPGHPQAALARLLQRLVAARADVRPLALAPRGLAAREAVLTQALLPPEFTTDWATTRATPAAQGDLAAGFDGISIVEAANDREEAMAVALAMRETAEIPGATAALVTPDRALAERVCVALARWGLSVEDSAGRALSRAPRGSFAALVAQWLTTPADGALLVALLSHPRVAPGLPRDSVARAAAAIDIGALRGFPPTAPLAALIAALPHRRDRAKDRHAPLPAQRLSGADWQAATRALHALAAIAIDFARATATGAAKRPLAVWAAAHRAALTALVRGDADDAGDWLADGRDGDALADLFDALAGAGRDSAPIARGDYPGVWRRLADQIALTPPAAAHPRLSIWGLLEARLLAADRIILGGLNENIWPPQPSPDAFLNRSLRTALGLPQPERRIGQTAHDFVAALAGARDALITRARKSGGAPTIPSRFWQRLDAYAGPRETRPERQTDADRRHPWTAALARGERYLALARALDVSGPAQPVARPSPKPPARLVPRRISVSRVETLVRDPYAIYARDILGLDPLPAAGVGADAALRGTLIHDAVARFAATIDPRDPDAAERLIALGRSAFAEAGVDDERILFWLPRFRRAARLFVDWARARHGAIAPPILVEQDGRLALALDDGQPFLLTGRADRIERLHDRSVALVDFKTGAPPSAKQVAQGFSPQLTLEAAMARRGAFDPSLKDRPASQLVYVRLSGARSGAFATDVTIPGRNGPGVDPDATPEKHLSQLLQRMNAHLAGRIGYASHASPDLRRQERGGDYDHLARVAEWTRGGDDE
jgi:ATP-dependent helicase/nuclease subunit B